VNDHEQRSRSDDPGAIDADDASRAELMARVYDQLRRLASGQLRHERGDHTLQPTALVHEAYMRMAAHDGPFWKDAVQFRAVAASVMRQVLVDHARRRGAEKRGGGAHRVVLDESITPMAGHVGGVDETAAGLDVLALDDAIRKLSQRHERQARIVELRFFGGLTVDQAAELLGISRGTVMNDWTVARAWLQRELSGDAPE